LYGCGADPKAAGQRAAREYAAHDYAAAQTDLATALSATPDDPGLLELHARNALALGNGEAAASSLDKLARSPHAPADMQKLVAEADLQRGLPDRTLADLGQATDPARRGCEPSRFSPKDRAGASKAIAAALAQAPDDPRILALAAQMDLQDGNLDVARGKINAALRSGGDLLEVMTADAQIATAQGDLAHALAAYDRAAGSIPATSPCSRARLVCRAIWGAGPIWKTLAVLGNSYNRDVIYLRARLAAEKKDWLAHAPFFRLTRSLSKGSRKPMLYGHVLLKLGQPAQASALLAPC
jgi:tetratricopeptide (TPR) repeat protein